MCIVLCNDLCTKGPQRQFDIEELNSNNGSYDVSSFVYVWLYVRMCMYVYVCIHVIALGNVYVFMYLFMCLMYYVCVFIGHHRIHVSNMHTYTYILVQAYIIHTYIHTYIHTFIHSYIFRQGIGGRKGSTLTCLPVWLWRFWVEQWMKQLLLRIEHGLVSQLLCSTILFTPSICMRGGRMMDCYLHF